jgi:hypothetical protein
MDASLRAVPTILEKQWVARRTSHFSRSIRPLQLRTATRMAYAGILWTFGRIHASVRWRRWYRSVVELQNFIIIIIHILQ